MPGFDRTGPEGKGSRTGRGLGKCKDPENLTGQEGDINEDSRGRGRGFGFFGFGRASGRGPGRGFGRGRR